MKESEKAYDYAKAALELAEKQRLVQLLWVVHFTMAKAVLSSHRREASNEEAGRTYRTAMAHYAKAVDAIEALRAGIGRPQERERLLTGKEQVYQQAMLFAGASGDSKSAWSFAERSRGRAFLNLLGASRITQQAEKHPLSARRSEVVKQLLEMKDASGAEGKALSDELRFGAAASAPKRQRLPL